MGRWCAPCAFSSERAAALDFVLDLAFTIASPVLGSERGQTLIDISLYRSTIPYSRVRRSLGSRLTPPEHRLHSVLCDRQRRQCHPLLVRVVVRLSCFLRPPALSVATGHWHVMRVWFVVLSCSVFLCSGVLGCPLGVTELFEPVSVDIISSPLNVRKHLHSHTRTDLHCC